MNRLLLFLSLLGIAISATAQDYQVSEPEVLSIANKVVFASLAAESTERTSMIGTLIDQGEYFIVNYESGAFVIVAADKRSMPLLAYSVESSSVGISENPMADWLLSAYSDQISTLKEKGSAPTTEVEQAWTKILGPSGFTMASFGVSPLLSSQWGQGCNYNADCPVDSAATGYYCYRVPTGCVATAMAQIMKYFEYPAQGNGNHSYLHFQYGSLSANYAASTYNRNQMPPYISGPAPEIAEIMFHSGVAVNMTYGPVNSGSYASDARTALVNYFKYASTTAYHQRVSFTDPVWNSMLKTEIDNGRPVFYGGVDPNGFGGHAWVVDGYQGSHYHINWGWEGAHNGYFLLNALDPLGNANFTNFHEAIMGIEPSSPILKAQFALNNDTLEAGDTAFFTDLSQGSPISWQWSFLNDNGPTVISSAQHANHLYVDGGRYDVQLIVSDGLQSDTLLKENVVIVLPIAEFSASTRRTVSFPDPAGAVDFYDQTISSNTVVSWQWNFGSSALPPVSSSKNPVGVLFPAGLNQVSLQIGTQNGKQSTIVFPDYIQAFPSCDTMFAASVPQYKVAVVDQANFSIGNYDLDALVPYYVAAGHTSDWHIYNDVIAPGDTNFFYGSTSWFQSPGEADNWLIFGPLSIPSSGAYLEWEHLFWLNNKRDGYEVLLSKTGGQVQDFVSLPIKAYIDNDPHTEGDVEWTYQSAELDSIEYGGNQVWIAFHHLANDMAYVFLDDFKLTSCQLWTGIETFNDLRVLNVYPNPVSDVLFLDIDTRSKEAMVYIYDIHGKLHFSGHLDSGEYSIDVAALSSGLYFLSAEIDGIRFRTRFIKM